MGLSFLPVENRGNEEKMKHIGKSVWWGYGGDLSPIVFEHFRYHIFPLMVNKYCDIVTRLRQKPM